MLLVYTQDLRKQDMTKTIHFIPKFTSAKTTYRELHETERAWLLNEMLQWVVKMATLSNTTNEDLKSLRNDYWRKRRSTLPRGRDGQNSPESMIAGILENMLYSDNPQRDFTEKQCEAIEDVSKWMAAVDDKFNEVIFQIGLFE